MILKKARKNRKRDIGGSNNGCTWIYSHAEGTISIIMNFRPHPKQMRQLLQYRNGSSKNKFNCRLLRYPKAVCKPGLFSLKKMVALLKDRKCAYSHKR